MKKYVKAEIKLVKIEAATLMEGSTVYATYDPDGSKATGTYAPMQPGSSTSSLGNEFKMEHSSWSGIYSADEAHKAEEDW